MTRYIAKLFAGAAIALSLLLVLDSVQGLAQPDVPITANLSATVR
jgi:hypothetical protein